MNEYYETRIIHRLIDTLYCKLFLFLRNIFTFLTVATLGKTLIEL